jgi:hypothetical protein
MIHGQKCYFQVLLDPSRSALLDALAEEKGLRPSALIRELTYQGLSRAYPASMYNLADAQDAAIRQESVHRQVEGRRRRPLTDYAGGLVVTD